MAPYTLGDASEACIAESRKIVHFPVFPVPVFRPETLARLACVGDGDFGRLGREWDSDVPEAGPLPCRGEAGWNRRLGRGSRGRPEIA